MFMSTITLKSRITNNNITNLRKKVPFTQNHPVVSNYGGKKFPTFALSVVVLQIKCSGEKFISYVR
jgi:hypothetical protein